MFELNLLIRGLVMIECCNYPVTGRAIFYSLFCKDDRYITSERGSLAINVRQGIISLCERSTKRHGLRQELVTLSLQTSRCCDIMWLVVSSRATSHCLQILQARPSLRLRQCKIRLSRSSR